jgi:surface polysaccharide O-acyltransferase-like enzyme
MGYILFFAGSLLSVPSFFLISSFLLIYGNSSFENHFNRRIVQNSIRLFGVTIIIVACLVFVILGSLNNSVWLIPLAFLCINAILVGTSKQQK